MKLWLLTVEYNDYDQHGEYFVDLYLNKPTHQDLTKHKVPTNLLCHVLNGGGLIDDEYEWWHLTEITPN